MASWSGEVDYSFARAGRATDARSFRRAMEDVDRSSGEQSAMRQEAWTMCAASVAGFLVCGACLLSFVRARLRA